MPLYKTGPYGPTATAPGDTLVMFDGTETPGANVQSIALSRATGPGNKPAGIVFTVNYGSTPTATCVIQASNEDVDSEYQVVNTFQAGAQNDWYSDLGNFAFYRAVLTAYSSGGMPKVVAQR